MADIKNYGIKGVGDDVQFGKKGGHLSFDGTSFMFGSPTAEAVVVTGIASPVNGGDAVNKDYVDGVAQGLDFKDSVRAATTGNIDLATFGLGVVDTIQLLPGDRVLVKDQTLPAENGIYVAAVAAWARADDANDDGEISGGSYVFVEEGAANISTSFVQTVAGDIVIGTDPQVWAIFARAGEIQAGLGLALNGDTLDVDLGELPEALVGLSDPDLVLSTNNTVAFSALISNNAGLLVQSFNGRAGAVVPVAGDYSGALVSYDGTASGIIATDVQAAIDELDGTLDGVGTDLTALEGRVDTAETDITNLEAADTALGDRLTAVEGVNVTQDTAIAGLVTKDGEHDTAIADLQSADTAHDDAISALQDADTAMAADIAVLADFTASDGIGTVVNYTPADLGDTGGPAALSVDLDYGSLTAQVAPVDGSEIIAVSNVNGMETVTTDVLKAFMVGDLSQNSIQSGDSSVTVVDDLAAGSIVMVVDGTPALSLNVNNAAFGSGASFFGDVSADSFTGDLVGNADTSSAWAAPMTLNVYSTEAIAGNELGSVSFDGSAASDLVLDMSALAADIGGNFVDVGGDTMTGGLIISAGGIDVTGGVRADSGAFTGDVSALTFTGALVGNADTATAWATPMTLNVEDPDANVLGTIDFDGSASPVLLTLDLTAGLGDYLTSDQASAQFVDVTGDSMSGALVITAGGLAVTGGTVTDTLAAGNMSFAVDTVTSDNDVFFALAADKLVRVTNGALYDTALDGTADNAFVTKSYMAGAIDDAVSAGAVGGVKTMMATVDLAANGDTVIGNLPAGAVVMSVRVNVTSVDATATLAVGSFMSVDENDPGVAGVYMTENMASGTGDVIATVAGSALTAGASADVLVEYRS